MKLFFLGVVMFVCSCASSTSTEKLIDSAWEDDRRPNWLAKVRAVYHHGGYVHFIGHAEVPEGSLRSSAYILSDMAARSLVASTLKSKIDSAVVVSGGADPLTSSQTIVSESSMTIRNIEISDRFWELIEKTDIDHKKSRTLKTYSLIRVSDEDFKILRENEEKKIEESKK